MKSIYFWIGTEAELIKVFPVIMECENQGLVCHIIATGQNDIKKSRIIDFIGIKGKFIELSSEKDIKKNAVGLMTWFFSTKRNAIKEIEKNFELSELKGERLVVHGDTVSTYMGALVGKKLKMTVCHVEAGLRSHNIFNPFPEEIDRLLTSRIAKVHFAPGEQACNNLKNKNDVVINTVYNTILDSLNASKKMEIVTPKVKQVLGQEYFVFVMHRQENLMNDNFVSEVMKRIDIISKQMKCVVILHKITENKLRELNYLDKIEKNENYILMQRVDYFDFMKLLAESQFVITDGGSNQEELHYMGKPCLIMRKTTERNEGIGLNAMLFDGNLDYINSMLGIYKQKRIEPICVQEKPSKIIVKYLKA